MSIDPAELTYDERGLIPVVVQDALTGAVLMHAWADRPAVERTLASGEACFWSRSRQAPWRKGESSGNTLAVAEVLADCDRDTLLVRAHPVGPTCHRGTVSCFEPNPARLDLGWLAAVIDERRGADPQASYTAHLLAQGVERVAQKVGEEAVEVVVAALAGEEPTGALAAESADLLYHLLVLLAARGVDLAAVAGELRARHRPPAVGPSDAGEMEA